MIATHFPGCTCKQGRRPPCHCAGMWSVEQASPWLLAVYAVALVGAIVASIFWPYWITP